MKTAVEQRSAHAYVVNGSFDLTGSDDTFVTSYQTRTLVETDDDASGNRFAPVAADADHRFRNGTAGASRDRV